MTIRLFLLATACAGIALAAISFRTWQSVGKDRQRLEAAIAAQQKLIAQIDTQEHARSTDLKASTDQIEALKRKVTTPGEAAQDLAQYLQLPAPITPVPQDHPASSGPQSDTSGYPPPSSATPLRPPLSLPVSAATLGGPPSLPGVRDNGFYLPSADAKPLFDFVQDSRLCELQLSSARSDLQDERAKSTGLARERDQAVRATKGEATVARLKRDAKCVLIGVALTLAASLSHHRP